jgi:acetylornithine deacetylase/succinyl-diaminopimelate desuccinylase-like protein
MRQQYQQIVSSVILSVVFCTFFVPATSQSSHVSIRHYLQQHEWEIANEYRQFIAIPNVFGDSINIRKNADFILAQLQQAGVSSQLLSTGIAGSAPVVYGEVNTPGATKTIAFYAHYDGQPVNAKEWSDGLAPFNPVLATDRLDKGGRIIPFPKKGEALQPEWRLYGRSSADDKAGVMQIINAYRAIIQTGQIPKVNIKFFFEGEEEAGSVNLGTMLEKNRDLLKADLWVICDGPRHQSGKKQIMFGVRGDINISLTVFGAKRPLHSGNYGNWAPNPAMQLVQLLATMKDRNGNVTIKNFYDDVVPFSVTEKNAIANIPANEANLKEELGIHTPDGNGKSYMELMNLPTLNINGIRSADVGKGAANVIPTTATAVLDLRTVLGNDTYRQVEKVKLHIQQQGYFITDKEPTDEERKKYPLIIRINEMGKGYNAQRTPMDLPIVQDVLKAVQTTVDYPVIQLPTLGGSLPLYLFEKYLHVPLVTVGAVNYDNNQHAENENVCLRYLWEGIESMAAIMMMKAAK